MRQSRTFCRGESGDDPGSPTRLDHERASDPAAFQFLPGGGEATAGEMTVEQVALFAAIQSSRSRFTEC